MVQSFLPGAVQTDFREMSQKSIATARTVHLRKAPVVPDFTAVFLVLEEDNARARSETLNVRTAFLRVFRRNEHQKGVGPVRVAKFWKALRVPQYTGAYCARRLRAQEVINFHHVPQAHWVFSMLPFALGSSSGTTVWSY